MTYQITTDFVALSLYFLFMNQYLLDGGLFPIMLVSRYELSLCYTLIKFDLLDFSGIDVFACLTVWKKGSYQRGQKSFKDFTILNSIFWKKQNLFIYIFQKRYIYQLLEDKTFSRILPSFGQFFEKKSKQYFYLYLSLNFLKANPFYGFYSSQVDSLKKNNKNKTFI
jgi:hypothetical protein